MPHLEALIRKLLSITNLDQDDIDAIKALPIQLKDIPTERAIVLEGDRPTQCCLMVEGFTVRSKTTEEGKRQILSIHIPGDIPDLQSLHLPVMDHDLKALSDCTLGFIPHGALRALTRSRPVVAEALWRDTLVDASIFREWIVNVGRRSAAQRMAHLVMEMRQRLAAIGRTSNEQFHLPMKQMDLADALGLSTVHVNRVLQALRAEGLMDMRKSIVDLADADKLMQIGDFNDMYLHQRPQFEDLNVPPLRASMP